MHIDSRDLPVNFHSVELATSGVAGNMTMLADMFPPNICWMSFPGRVFGSTTQECRGLQLDHRASRFGAMPDMLFVSASSPRPPSPKEEVGERGEMGGGHGREWQSLIPMGTTFPKASLSKVAGGRLQHGRHQKASGREEGARTFPTAGFRKFVHPPPPPFFFKFT